MKKLTWIAVLLFSSLAFGGGVTESFLSPALYLISPSVAQAAQSPVARQIDGKADPFQGYPILERIAACESTGSPDGKPRQFNADGSPLWGNDPKTGKPIKRDVGVMQINTWAHATELSKLGFDVINSEADNVAYGKLLYARNGTKDWTASAGCWK